MCLDKKILGAAVGLEILIPPPPPIIIKTLLEYIMLTVANCNVFARQKGGETMEI